MLAGSLKIFTLGFVSPQTFREAAFGLQTTQQETKAMNRSFTIKIKQNKRKGHQSHRSGAGQHQDRRTKRQRTRQAQSKKAIEAC